MLKRIPFTVVYASSNEEKAKRIEHIDPNARGGWDSDIFCEWPQTLILLLNGGNPVTLSELQVMSHESRIAQRTEVLATVSHKLDNLWTEYHPLGYFHFRDNETSGYRAREIKTVQLNVKCNLVMLRFYACHMNPNNLFNQIGIGGISLLGDWVTEAMVGKGYYEPNHLQTKNELDKMLFLNPHSTSQSETPVELPPYPSISKVGQQQQQPRMPQPFPGRDGFSPDQAKRLNLPMTPQLKNPNVDDRDRHEYNQSKAGSPMAGSPNAGKVKVVIDGITFDMRYDKATAMIIRECQAAKLYFAERDQFEEAAALKAIEDTLKDTAVTISTKEALKAKAIRADDYKLAKRINGEIDELRKPGRCVLDDSEAMKKYRDREFYENLAREDKIKKEQDKAERAALRRKERELSMNPAADMKK
jgi:hypothetical protein